MKKKSISQLQKDIWKLCKQIIREVYGNTCYTCGKGNLEGSNWHTGHLYPKGALGAFLKYDLRVLRPQCYHCNINLGGMGAVFITNIRRFEGEEYINQLEIDRQKTIKAYDYYQEIYGIYKSIAEQHPDEVCLRELWESNLNDLRKRY